MAIPTLAANVMPTAVAWESYLSAVMVRFVRSLSPAMTVIPMRVVAAMRIVADLVREPPAAIVKSALNSKLVMMVSPMLVVAVMLTVPERGQV